LSFTTIDSIVFQSGPRSTRHSVSNPIEVDFQFEELEELRWRHHGFL
jgi:hypothetical protein